MPEKLFEIPSSEWNVLRDLYEPSKDQTSSYYFLQNCLDWKQKCPDFEIKIYAVNDEWPLDGTFIADIPAFYHIYCNSLANTDNNLQEAFKLLEKKLNYLLFGFHDRALRAVETYYVKNGFPKEYFILDAACWYMLPKGKALEFNTRPPVGYSTDSLRPCHVDHINSLWPYRGTGTVDFIQHLVTYNQSVGVFDENGNLVGWCMILPLGEMGILHVEKKHQRRGLGSLLVRSLSKKMALLGQNSFAAIVATNIPSRSMFEKLGFKWVDMANWIYTPPSC